VVNRSVVTKGPIMRCYLPLVVAPANYVRSLDPYGPPFGPLKPLIRRWGRWASFTANLHCEPQAVAHFKYLIIPWAFRFAPPNFVFGADHYDAGIPTEGRITSEIKFF
jgi:hypothetical protein